MLLAGVSAAVLRAARRRPYLPVGWFWYLLAMVPVIGIVQVGSQPMADRYTYLPIVGLFVMLAWGVHDLAAARSQRVRFALATACALVLAACTLTARAQARHWSDSVALWEHTLAVTHDNARAENNLAHALTKLGRLDDALVHYGAAVRIKPDYAEAHNNLGYVLAQQRKTAQAIAHYREALRSLPDYEEAHNNLGVALLEQGALDEAIPELEAALRIRPDRPESRSSLALAHSAKASALADQGNDDGAIREFQEALRLRPDDADHHYDLAVMYYRKGRAEDAAAELKAALTLDPRHAQSRRMLEALANAAPRQRSR